VVWGEMGEHDRLQGSEDWHAEKNSKHVELRLDLTKSNSLFSTSVSADDLQLSLSSSPYFPSDLMGNVLPRWQAQFLKVHDKEAHASSRLRPCLLCPESWSEWLNVPAHVSAHAECHAVMDED
jgi:hypothetical protein